MVPQAVHRKVVYVVRIVLPWLELVGLASEEEDASTSKVEANRVVQGLPEP